MDIYNSYISDFFISMTWAQVNFVTSPLQVNGEIFKCSLFQGNAMEWSNSFRMLVFWANHDELGVILTTHFMEGHNRSSEVKKHFLLITLDWSEIGTWKCFQSVSVIKNASNDMRLDLFRSTSWPPWPWPYVKFWKWPPKVTRCMFRFVLKHDGTKSNFQTWMVQK